MEWMAEEVSNHDELLEIFKVCDTLHLAINNGQYPYLVPLSYGVEYVDHHIVLYFHGVEEGMKDELFKKNPHVTCSVDVVYEYNEKPEKISAVPMHQPLVKESLLVLIAKIMSMRWILFKHIMALRDFPMIQQCSNR